MLNDVIIVVHTVLATISGGHALMYKRDPRASLSWIVVCIFFPVIGPLLYFWFGINRVQLKARRLLKNTSENKSVEDSVYFNKHAAVSLTADQKLHCQSLMNVANAITDWPLVGRNDVSILHNGDQAYPEMLDTIKNARTSIYLMTYIFDTDHIGTQFIDALVAAKDRGVNIKVLIDGVGELGLQSRASSRLSKAGIEVARYLPLTFRPPAFYWNLRNHRKLLIVDNTHAFTGGMNISSRHILSGNHSRDRVVDLHFKICGPVILQLEKIFIEDWRFATQKRLEPQKYSGYCEGDTLCRAIVDGPSYDVNKLAMILIGAVSSASERIVIMTPYFLPSRELIAALQAASLRGVKIEIVLPEKNDSRLVHWATRNMLWQLLQFNIRIHYQTEPFVHSKIFIVDSYYLIFGSSNIDPRSLRLNFELNIESYDLQLVDTVIQHVDECIAESREISFNEVENRAFLVKIRDSLAWLFSPYL